MASTTAAGGTMPESFPMNGGDGTYSYTKNSQYQRAASSTAKELISEAIAEKLDVHALTSASHTFCMADLGCSVGPNTFVAMQNVLESVQKTAPKDLEFQVFFNDHVSNDFNTLFATLPPNRQYFAAGVPGSFYDQLFPSSSLHFMHSSYALHWLSTVPEELVDEKSCAFNKGKIHYASASDEVASAYAGQFGKDMEVFLSVRAKEIMSGGMMVLIMPGLPDGTHCSELPAGVLFDFLGSTLLDMVNAGLIDEAKVDSFNLPIYAPTPREMTEVVGRNGCFSVERMEITDPMSKMGGAIDVKGLIMHLRAGMEGIFTKHFGSEVIDELFQRSFEKSAELSKRLESCYKKGTQLFIVLKHK